MSSRRLRSRLWRSVLFLGNGLPRSRCSLAMTGVLLAVRCGIKNVGLSRHLNYSLFIIHYSFTKKSPSVRMRIFLCWRYLFSRPVTRQVSSAKVCLTSVFGMGTGGPTPQSTPTIYCSEVPNSYIVQHRSSLVKKNGDPYRIRTDVNGVRGRCLNHLTNGPHLYCNLQTSKGRENSWCTFRDSNPGPTD